MLRILGKFSEPIECTYEGCTRTETWSVDNGEDFEVSLCAVHLMVEVLKFVEQKEV